MKTIANLTQYTPEHDAVMSTYLEPIHMDYSFMGDFQISVKVPESFTFVEFKSGWDQDDYIHNRKAHEIARELGLEFQVLQDYPRYSPKDKLQDALRFFFKSEGAALRFINAIESEIAGVTI
jgi:hypothetical protein